MGKPLAEYDRAGCARAEAKGDALKDSCEVEHPDDGAVCVQKNACYHKQRAEGYHLLHAEFFNELAVEYTHDGVRAAVKRDGQCVCGAGYLGMRLEDGFHIQRHGAERKTGIYKLHQYQQYKYDPRIVAALYESTFLHC